MKMKMILDGNVGDVLHLNSEFLGRRTEVNQRDKPVCRGQQVTSGEQMKVTMTTVVKV